jgi:hypothetical protein
MTEMLLLADCVRLAEQRDHFGVEVASRRDPKGMEMVFRRNRLYGPKMPTQSDVREDDVSIEPLPARRDLSKRHPDLKGYARFFRNDDYPPNSAHSCHESVVEFADLLRFITKVML